MRPDVRLDDAVVAVDHPRAMFTEECPDVILKVVVGEWRPVWLVVYPVEFEPRKPEGRLQTTREGRLSRSTASDDGDSTVDHPIIIAWKPSTRLRA